MLGQAAACQGDALLGFGPFDGFCEFCLIFFAGFEDDFTLGAVHGDDLSALDAFGSNACAHHSRDAVLARDDAAVRERPADIGHHGGSHGEERRPGGSGGASHQHIAGLHLVEVFGAAKNTRRGGDLSNAGGLAFEHVASLGFFCLGDHHIDFEAHHALSSSGSWVAV